MINILAPVPRTAVAGHRSPGSGARCLPACSLVLVAVALQGCASGDSRSFGDSIGAESARYGAISEQWQDGQDKIDKGRKRIRKGRKEERSGAERIRSGESLVAEGERMKRTAEQSYDSSLRAKGLPPLGSD